MATVSPWAGLAPKKTTAKTPSPWTGYASKTATTATPTTTPTPSTATPTETPPKTPTPPFSLLPFGITAGLEASIEAAQKPQPEEHEIEPIIFTPTYTPLLSTKSTPLVAPFAREYYEQQGIPFREIVPFKYEARVFGQSLTYLPEQIAASILQATQGEGGASVANRDWADEYIANANENIDKFTRNIVRQFPTSSYLHEVSQLSRNLAYSITSMGAGVATGAAIAWIPLPGARAAAWAAGSATSGAVAYQMTTYQITQEYLELKNAEKIEQTGVGITIKEENELKKDFHDLAVKYGLWEAVPEAISNLLFGQLLFGSLSKMIGGSMATQIIQKLAAMYGEEFLTETITQKGQSGIEVEAGLRENRIGWVEAFKEIAPQTFLLTTVMAGAGQVVIGSTQGIKKITNSLKNEIGKDHPLYDEIKEGIETETETIITPTVAQSGQSFTATVYRGQTAVPTDEGLVGKAQYWTTDPAYAATYGEVTESTVRLNNPLAINTQRDWDALGYRTRELRDIALEQGRDEDWVQTELREQLIAEGHDGVVIAEGIVETGKQIAAFHPEDSITRFAPTTAMASWGTKEAPITKERIPLVINEYRNQLARKEAELARTKFFAPKETSQIKAQERGIEYLKDAISDLESQSLTLAEGETVTGREWETTAMAEGETVSGEGVTEFETNIPMSYEQFIEGTEIVDTGMGEQLRITFKTRAELEAWANERGLVEHRDYQVTEHYKGKKAEGGILLDMRLTIDSGLGMEPAYGKDETIRKWYNRRTTYETTIPEVTKPEKIPTKAITEAENLLTKIGEEWIAGRPGVGFTKNQIARAKAGIATIAKRHGIDKNELWRNVWWEAEIQPEVVELPLTEEQIETLLASISGKGVTPVTPKVPPVPPKVPPKVTPEVPPGGVPEGKPAVIRRADIIKELSEKLNVPIRRGHYRGKAVGIYKRGQEIIRLRKGEVTTVAHEVGHLLDDRYNISNHIPKDELPALLKEYPGKPRRKYAEAFAEYVRHYVTNPRNVKSIAPEFHKYFTEEFLASNPDIQDILNAARDDYARWLNMPSTAKIASQLSVGEPKKFNLPQKLSDFYTAAWDDLYPMQDFVKTAQKLGVEVVADENPYMLARLLRGKHGRIHTFLEQGTFGKQFWKVEKGKTVPDFTGKSLKQILAPLETKGRLDDFRIYLVARRALRLANKGIETGIAKGDASAAITELESKFPSFGDTATEIYKFQASVWQYAHESGLITKGAQAKLTRTNTDYVPFYRVMEELQARGYMGKTLANIRAPVHPIKGSERLIVDPLESIVKNTYAIMDAADRNQVGIMLARLAGKNKILTQLFEPVATPISKVAQVNAEELGVKFPELTEKDVDTIINIFRPSLFYGKDNTLSVLIDGKKKFFQVDPDLYKAIMSIEREQAGLIVKLLSYPAKWLRAGAVLSPDFWILKNPLRDTMTAFAYSQYGFMPALDTARGLFEFLGKGKAYQMWRMSGGEHAMLVSLDRQYLRKSFREIVKGKGLVEYVRHPLEALQAFAEFTESATRLGEFKRAIAKGATPVEAGFASREVSLDFACIGAQTKSMNMITAFWNANMRAMDKLARHATQPKLAGRFYGKVLLGITLPSILLYFANRDDPRWDEIPQWQKDLFWIIFTPDHIYRIPKPFELGILFGSLPERILEYLDTTDPKCIEDVLKNAGESMNPGFLPTALLPIVESLTNYNFFLGRQIVPESLEDMPPELQYTVYTPEIIKELGEWVNYSPLKIQNILKGYTAGLGGYVTDALNSMLKGTGVLPDIPEPSPTLADYPVIKSIIVRDPYGSGSASVEEFYDSLDELYKGERYLKEMLRKGEVAKFRKYKAEHPEVMLFFDYGSGETYSAARRFLTQQSQILADLRTKQREIYTSPDMTPEEKRATIDEINHLITDTARLALGHLEAMPGEFSTEGVIEPMPEEAELYVVMEKLPKALRDYLWENKDTIGAEQWETWEDKFAVWRDTDELLIDTYYEETKGQSPQDKYAYRKKNPDCDVALNFWGHVTTRQSSTARRLLKERATSLGIPSLWEETEPISPWTGKAKGEGESPWAGATTSPWAGMSTK